MTGHRPWNKLRGQRGSNFEVVKPVKLPTSINREDLIYYRDNSKNDMIYFRNTEPGRILRNWGNNGRALKEIKHHLEEGYVPVDPRRELGIYSTIYSAFGSAGRDWDYWKGHKFGIRYYDGKSYPYRGYEGGKTRFLYLKMPIEVHPADFLNLSISLHRNRNLKSFSRSRFLKQVMEMSTDEILAEVAMRRLAE